MNNPSLLPPKSDNSTDKIQSLALTILENGEIRIPWIPLEFEVFVKRLLPEEDQDHFLFGPMLCG